ncbi:putative ATPase [Asanoa ferruginea]|uniref:Putative ATPase n=1 Tax=Asanoa ferruginea TaxID=53367 RepID=A0A3D9ZUJ2_9ACTN|nr:LuxR C-terminal-related transcriptional regulator [Asanoa ferruginea]REG00133.1 putative ATPase [Asanoa ferruginea]GIF46172.1 hypothetical protein Afe04nite_07110 [Asanoa ferruginea]
MTVAQRGIASQRETEVLGLVGAGLSNVQIANRLHISVRTAESHVSSLLRKYGVADRQALAALADRPGRPGVVAQLPAPRTSFVGRAVERDAVLAGLAAGRLVTLTGPGGVGKTRLASVIAEAAGPGFPAGGAFVDLVPVREGGVARAAATALGVIEGPHQPLEEAVVERLGRGRSLLVLDNCEHVVDAAAGFVERVLTACPDTTVLATSRERLGVPGEHTVAVPPLPLASDAELLFHDRARAADPGFAAEPSVISALCARLDGIPLAIELAAARTAALGAGGLLAALDDHLRALVGGRGADARHRSLRAVLGWSHDLLDEEERRFFRDLAVFVGAFDLTAATAVTGAGSRPVVADLLGRLVDKSLVVFQRDRWRLLGTVRAFALDHLRTAPEAGTVRDRHLAWATDTARALEDRLHGDEWCADFDAVADDLRAALADSARGPEEGPRLDAVADDLRAALADSAPGPEEGPRFDAVADDLRDSARGPEEGPRLDAVTDDLRAAPADSAPGPQEGPHFDAVADDLRVAPIAGPRRALGGELRRRRSSAHALARSLGHLCYARRHVIESARHYQEAARLAPTPRAAMDDLLDAAAAVRMSRAPGTQTFDLLLAAAERAAAAGDGDARAIALAQAAEMVHRHPAMFSESVPAERVRAIMRAAAEAGDPANPLVAARLAVAEVWTAATDDTIDPALADAAVAAARAAGDPVVLSAALDALRTAAVDARRFADARAHSAERRALLATVDRAQPAAGPEIADMLISAMGDEFAAGDLHALTAAARALRDDDLVGNDSYSSIASQVAPLVLTGDLTEALRCGQIAWEGWQRAGRPAAGWLAQTVALTALACGLQDDDAGFRLWRSRVADVARVPDVAGMRLATSVFADVRTAVHRGDHADARGQVERAFGAQGPWHRSYAVASGAELAVVAGLPDAADLLDAAATETAGNAWAAACLARAAGRLHDRPAALSDAADRFAALGARFEHAATLLLVPDRAAEARTVRAALDVPARPS